MGKNAKLKRALGLVSALVVLTGMVYGCYSKGGGTEKADSYGQHIKMSSVSAKELRKFGESLRKVDGEAEAHYKLALYFQERSRHRLAIDELKQVLRRDPNHAKAYNALGVSCDWLSDHKAAIDYYKLALKIDPKLDYSYNNLGYSYLLKGDHQRAVEAFLQAIALNGQEKRYRNNLGLAYVKQDKYELAYEQFLVLDSDANAEKTLAKVMQDLGKSSDTERVLLAIKSAQKVDPPVGAVEQVDNLPQLAAARSETTSSKELVERFPSTNNPTPSSSDDFVEPSTEETENSGPAETAVQVIADDKRDAFSGASENPLAGPVIRLPPALAQDTYEVKIAPAAPEGGFEEAAAENRQTIEHYLVSSAAVSLQTDPIRWPAALAQPIDALQEERAAKKPLETSPAHIEIVAALNAEDGRERLLVASWSSQAAGWQDASKLKQPAEQGLVEVEVANGNGVKSAAAKVARHLRLSGFKVVRVMDANSFDHFITKVFHDGSSRMAVQRLLNAIPEITGDAELYELQSPGTPIRLLVGKDLVERNSALTWDVSRRCRSQTGG